MRKTKIKQKYNKKIKLSKALTWDDVADEYKKLAGRTAKTQPMEDVFRYLAVHTDLFKIDPEQGTIHKILK